VSPFGGLRHSPTPWEKGQLRHCLRSRGYGTPCGQIVLRCAMVKLADLTKLCGVELRHFKICYATAKRNLP